MSRTATKSPEQAGQALAKQTNDPMALIKGQLASKGMVFNEPDLEPFRQLALS